jgi:hypothetical protein
MKETLVFHYTNVEMSEDEIHLFFFKVRSVHSKLPHESWVGGRGGCVFNNCQPFGPSEKTEKGFLGYKNHFLFLFFFPFLWFNLFSNYFTSENG